MAIRAQMHNGTILEFPDDTPSEVIDNAAKNYLGSLNAPTESTPAPAPVEQPKQQVLPADNTSSDFMRALRNEAPMLRELGGAAQVIGGQALKKLGATDTASWLTEHGMENMNAGNSGQVSKPTDTFAGAWEQGIGSVVTDYLPYIAGETTANILESMGFAAAGAAVGAGTGMGVGAVPGAVTGFLEKQLIAKGVKEIAENILKTEGKEAAEKYVAKEAAKTLTEVEAKTALQTGARSIGTNLGLAGQAGFHGLGEVGSRAIQEEQEAAQKEGREVNLDNINLARVLPAAAIHSVADFINEKIGLGAIKGLRGTATESLLKDIITRAGVTGLKEIPGEEVQQAAERLGANLSLADAEAFKEYGETAIASFLMGAMPGAIGGARTHLMGTAADNKKATNEEIEKLRQNLTNYKPPSEDNATFTPEQAAHLQVSTDENGNPLSETLADAPNIKQATDTSATPAPNKVAPANVANETFDMLNSEEAKTKADQLATDNARIQAKLDAGEYKSDKAVANAKAKIARQQTEIDSLKTQTASSVATPAKESIYAVPIKNATDYIAELETNKSKPNASKLAGHLRALGITDVETGSGFNQRAIDAIKQKLAIGEQNVPTSTVNAADRVSSQISGQQGADTTAAGTTTTESGGVGGIKPPAQVSQTGEGTERPALTPEEKTAAYAKSKAELDQAQVGPPVRNEAFTTINPAESQAALEKDQAQAAQDEAARQAALQEVAGQNIPQTKTDEDIRQQYDITRTKLGEEGVAIPAWDSLKADEKDKYLGTLPADATVADYENAAKGILQYKEQKKGSGLKPAEQRIVNGYEENRPIFQRSLGIDIPAWGSLSPEAQSAYTSKVKTNSPVEQDAGFTAVAEQLEQEGHGIRNVSREGIRNLKLKGTEEVAKARTAAEIAQAAATEASAQGKGETLTEETKAKLIAGDINGVLSDLISSSEGFKGLNLEKGDKTYRQAYAYLAGIRKRASALTFRLIAASLNKLRFNSKVVTDPNNKVIQRLEQEGKLAEYDPKTDTFYFTPGGFDESTVLHEIVHAGTVKIISQYLKDPSKLTQEQRDAAEHLQKIYDFSKKRLGGKFKNAYENLYEFVSYAMTDNKFQIALAEMQVRPLAKYTAKAMAAWKQFTQALSKMFGLYDAKAQTEELTPEAYHQVAKEWGSMDPDELYQNAVLSEIETLELGDIHSPNLWTAGDKVKETDVKVKKQKVLEQGRRFLTTYPGYEGNLMLEMSEVFSRILASPEKGIKVAPLAAKKQGAAKKEATPSLEVKVGEPDIRYSTKANPGIKPISFIWNVLKTPSQYKLIAKKFVNKKYYMRDYFIDLERAEKLIYEGENINDVNSLTTLASGETRQFITMFVSPAVEKVNMALANFAKIMGYSTEFALEEAHKYVHALTDSDRRKWKYVFHVPLRENKILNNGTLSPADRRDQIINLAKQDGVILSKQQQLQLRNELNALSVKYADPLGRSPASKTKPNGTRDNSEVPVDPDSVYYNSTGLNKDEADLIAAYYEDPNYKGKTELNELKDSIRELTHVTKQLNRMSNFWSQPVENIVGIMNYENYVPLKGKGDVQHSDVDSMLNLEFDNRSALAQQDQLLGVVQRTGKGREFQEVPHATKGRRTVSDNPILVAITDATKAASRAGRRTLTKAIMNCLEPDKKLNPNGQGLIKGYVKMIVKFADRDNINLDALKGETTLFHYAENGDLVVMVITDKKLRDSIRSTYEDSNWAENWLNKVTSTIGSYHTRYNYNFAPNNFIRDAFTNAGLISAKYGVHRGIQYVGTVVARVINGGIGKSFMVSTLLYKVSKGDNTALKQLNRMAEKDEFVKDMIDHIKRGGNSSYIESMALSNNFKNLADEVGRSGIKGYVLTKKDHINKFLDNWNNMFELTSRVTARGVIRSDLEARGANKEEATFRATAEAKDLTNFEWSGDWGKLMGGLYMFFRPSAITAARTIEALTPAFRDVSKVKNELPPVIRDNPQALAKWEANYKREQRNARITIGVAFGAGMLTYGLSGAIAPSDDDDRNKCWSDDMSLWTRYARFHIPDEISEKLNLGKNVVFQMPWGFGLGAFAAMGAQIAAAAKGNIPWSEAMKNTATQIITDSFLPIPVSRMDFGESPLTAIIDSVAPSFIRPALELTWNKNGLGQDIIASTNSRFGDAYIGGDNVPEVFKDASRWILDNMELDISPSAVYFLANSYIDGISKIGELTYGISDMQKGGQFNPKYDLPLLGSFFGAEINIDAREFAQVKEKIENKMQVYNQMATDPEAKAIYEDRHPFDPVMFKQYDYVSNGQLKTLESEAKAIRINKSYSKEDRQYLLEINKFKQNIIKNNLVRTFKEYGIKP